MCPERVGGERGQALVIVVALVGLAALVVTSLDDAERRILAQLRAQRAAEAAAEAGGVIVADHLARPRGDDGVDIVAAAVTDASLAARAADAARTVLVPMRASLDVLRLERRVDEVSVRAEVRRDGVAAVARVGVRARGGGAAGRSLSPAPPLLK